MSRAYRISVSESMDRHILVSDGICAELELLDVLGAQAMADLLAAELSRRGFTRQGECEMTRQDDDGVEISVGISGDTAGHVTVRLSREADVVIAASRTQSTRRNRKTEEVEHQLREQVARDLERREHDEREQLSAEVTDVLEKKLRDIRAELIQISNRVTAEALKVRAGQLGEIREITEDPETGSLTIKVHI